MKEKITACVVLTVVVGFVIFNTCLLNKYIDQTISDVEELSLISADALSAATEVYDTFKKRELYISLTVNHEDLTSIENLFSEMIGQLTVSDIENAKITKHRLMDALKHLRRLSGFNIDAII